MNSKDFFDFEWDDGNSKKSVDKHGVDHFQVESSFLDNEIVALGVQYQPLVKEDRYGIIAKDFEGNVLFTCFTLRAKKIRVISSRLASQKEKDLYYEK